MKRLSVILATGFGLGYFPVASGTVGTLPGVLIALAAARLPAWQQAAIAAALAAIAIPVCGAAETVLGRKDDGRIVADEYVTFPLCVIGLPIAAHPWLLVPAFLFHRVFDILKPFPARRIQALKGGWGVVLDDVSSGLYALAANHALWWMVNR
ncbi:MAG: phosphatidylglycerophosphatase A [Lentisphaerae bacterium]|nr:phosphatidylglycerophosphatase A [Lentisphaerota bacterium]